MQRVTFAVLLALWLLAPSAAAQGSAAAAEALFIEGKTALDAGDYELACAKLRESDRLDPAAGTKLNLADCERRRGRLATAWELFRAVHDDPHAGIDRHVEALQQLEALGARVPRLTLRLADGAPPDTTVRIGGAELGKASFGAPLPLDPGPQQLVVRAPGYAERPYTIELAEGTSDELIVAPGDPLPPEALPPPPVAVVTVALPPPPAPPRDTGPSSATIAGLTTGGVGIAALGVAIVTGVLTLDRRSTVDEHCRDDLGLCDAVGAQAADEGRTLGAVTTVGIVTSAIGLATGTVLLVLGRDREAADARGLVVRF